jgi:hypothetical protein
MPQVCEVTDVNRLAHRVDCFAGNYPTGFARVGGSLASDVAKFLSDISKARCGAPVRNFYFRKSNEADSEEAASLSEEGYRRADCSPPELTCVTLGPVDGQRFGEVSRRPREMRVLSHLRGRIQTGKRDSSAAGVEG